eukprot:5694516-Amphidinium_carterae.1
MISTLGFSSLCQCVVGLDGGGGGGGGRCCMSRGTATGSCVIVLESPGACMLGLDALGSCLMGLGSGLGGSGGL